MKVSHNKRHKTDIKQKHTLPASHQIVRLLQWLRKTDVDSIRPRHAIDFLQQRRPVRVQLIDI